MKLSSGVEVVLTQNKCSISVMLLCHFSACWLLPGEATALTRGPWAPKPGLTPLRGLCKVHTLWAQSFCAQGNLCLWREDWILMRFRGGILYSDFLTETLALFSSLLCVPVNQRVAFGRACLLVQVPLHFCCKWLISQNRSF